MISAFKPPRKFLEVAPISVRLVGGQSLYVNLLQGNLVRSITLFLFAALAVTSIDAASYQQNDGTIVDPIHYVEGEGGGDHPYSGPTLQPYVHAPGANLESADLLAANLSDANLLAANLSDAYLYGADLTSADLTSADLSGANLNYANLINAWLDESIGTDTSLHYVNLTDASLTNADLTGADLTYADLTSADLSGSILTDTQYYNDATWTDAFYYTDNEPYWDSGMNAAWRSSVGILALAPTSAVPEPSTILLALLGLVLLPRRRRR